MPIEKGFIKCSVCDSDATVYEAEGKRKNKLYVVCPECGTDQSSKETRQNYIIKNMVSAKEDLKIQPVEVETKQEIADKEQSNSFLKSIGIGLCFGLFIFTGVKVSGGLR